jgi:hypothetical protein
MAWSFFWKLIIIIMWGRWGGRGWWGELGGEKERDFWEDWEKRRMIFFIRNFFLKDVCVNR